MKPLHYIYSRTDLVTWIDLGWTKLQIRELLHIMRWPFYYGVSFFQSSTTFFLPPLGLSSFCFPCFFSVLCKSTALCFYNFTLSSRRINSLQLTSLTPTHLLCPSRIQQDSFLDRVLSQLGTLEFWGPFPDSSFPRHFTGQVLLSMKNLLGIYSW